MVRLLKDYGRGGLRCKALPDVYCNICGEPWDYYEVQHEFTKKERFLFKSGQGCPDCKGKRPDTALSPEELNTQFIISMADAME